MFRDVRFYWDFNPSEFKARDFSSITTILGLRFLRGLLCQIPEHGEA